VDALALVCPACAARHLSSVVRSRDRLGGAAGEWTVYRCGECGLLSTFPRPEQWSPREYGAEYPSYERDAPSTRTGMLGRVRDALALRAGVLHDLSTRPPGRLLDVGCGAGRLGAAFVRAGWEVDGVEPAHDAAAMASRRGVRVRAATLEQAPWVPATFDAVLFHHSLEHVSDPVGALRRAGALVRRDGVVAVAVPNFASWQRRLFGSRWFQLDLPRHLSHFEPSSLIEVAARAGLRVRDMRQQSSAISFWGSLQYVLADRCVVRGTALKAALLGSHLVYPVFAAIDRVGHGDCLNVILEPGPVAEVDQPRASSSRSVRPPTEGQATEPMTR
jgi:SAM-dependent methyltransferase